MQLFGQGRREGGREGASAPPHLPNFPLLPVEFFSNMLVAHPQPLVRGQIIFWRNEIHNLSQRFVTISAFSCVLVN
jgi:hypothetical protein